MNRSIIRSAFAAALAMPLFLSASAHAESTYDRVFRTPIGSRSNGLSVNVGYGAPRNGSGTVGHFNGISQRGATVNVQHGGQTSFSLPSNIANYNNLHAGTQGNVTIQRSDVGGTAHFTITSR